MAGRREPSPTARNRARKARGFALHAREELSALLPGEFGVACVELEHDDRIDVEAEPDAAYFAQAAYEKPGPDEQHDAQRRL